MRFLEVTRKQYIFTPEGAALAPKGLRPGLQTPCASGLAEPTCLYDRWRRLPTDSFLKAMPCHGTRLPAGPPVGEEAFELGRPRLSDVQLLRSSGHVALMPTDGVRQRASTHVALGPRWHFRS